MGIFYAPANTTAVQGIPIGRLNNIDNRVSALEQAGGSSGFQQPTSGAVDGSNATFVWTKSPNVIVVDQGRPMQRISSDGTVNWTVSGSGPYTTVLAVAPNYDVFATA